jgi:hypothetical protein
MPLQYSCFISYRHTTGYKGRTYTERIVEDLKADLELRVAREVYRDTDRLRGAEFYREALATAICRSVCMVVLFWPGYFSEEHTFCAREFRAMEELEAQRLALLPGEERQQGLIVILALRDFGLIPADIRTERLCKDFEAHTLKRNMRNDPAFQRDIFEVGTYIAGRVRAFQRLTVDVSGQCVGYRLPPEQVILPWVRQIEHPRIPFVNRPGTI